ncbi:MAG: ABC transporter permease, partial [Anaerolineales bacterium]|nr:ABC transporter permease [Anaerolineales bacterium]
MASKANDLKQASISVRRQRTYGILFILIAAAIWFFFSRTLPGGAITTFVLNLSASSASVPDWKLPTLATLNILAVLCAFLGGFQIVRGRGFGRYSNSVLALVAGMFIFSFLSWAAADKSLNLAGLLNSALSKAVPLTLGALSGVLCERAGVVNIAIEGMMLSGAMVGVLAGSLTGNLWFGLLCAVLAGAFLGLIHAVLSIKYKTDQIVSGTVINIFSTGITSFISAKFLQVYQDLNNSGIFSVVEIPALVKIPVIGPILFSNNIFVYAMFFFLVLIHVALFHTRWGLRLRSVGEHPKAADTLGINVFRTRYMAVILGGMMAGFAGGYFT